MPEHFSILQGLLIIYSIYVLAGMSVLKRRWGLGKKSWRNAASSDDDEEDAMVLLDNKAKEASEGEEEEEEEWSEEGFDGDSDEDQDEGEQIDSAAGPGQGRTPAASQAAKKVVKDKGKKGGANKLEVEKQVRKAGKSKGPGSPRVMTVPILNQISELVDQVVVAGGGKHVSPGAGCQALLPLPPRAALQQTLERWGAGVAAPVEAAAAGPIQKRIAELLNGDQR